MKRQLFLWVLLIVFLWAVITHLTEIERMAKTLTEGKWQYILAAGRNGTGVHLIGITSRNSCCHCIGIQGTFFLAAHGSGLFPAEVIKP